MDSQRIFYENKKDQLATQLSNLSSQVESLTGKVTEIKQKNQKIETKNKLKEQEILGLVKGKEKADKKLQTWKEKCELTKQILLEEKEVRFWY